MKPLYCSAIFIGGLIVLVLLLGLAYGVLEVTRLQLPIWQIITLHLVFCWIAIILRQRRLRRKWERLQAAGDAQLPETT